MQDHLMETTVSSDEEQLYSVADIPLIFENVKTDGASDGADVRMPDLCDKLYLMRKKHIL